MAANLEQELIAKGKQCLEQNNLSEAETHFTQAFRDFQSQEALCCLLEIARKEQDTEIRKSTAKLLEGLRTGDYSLFIQSTKDYIAQNKYIIFHADSTKLAQLSFEPAESLSTEDVGEELEQQKENKNHTKCCRIM